jgi:hypothetical protein
MNIIMSSESHNSGDVPVLSRGPRTADQGTIRRGEKGEYAIPSSCPLGVFSSSTRTCFRLLRGLPFSTHQGTTTWGTYVRDRNTSGMVVRQLTLLLFFSPFVS